MVFLLVVATLVAPVLALLLAEHLRERRQHKTRAGTVEEDQSNG